MKFKTWRTIKLGTGLKNAGNFINALSLAQCQLGDWGTRALLQSEDFVVSPNPIEVQLVNLRLAELKISDDLVPADSINYQAQQLGLSLCQPEVGPQLRLQYLDQPGGKQHEGLFIGMHPISVKPRPIFKEKRLIFYVDRDNLTPGLWLGATEGTDTSFSPDDRFVFIQKA